MILDLIIAKDSAVTAGATVNDSLVDLIHRLQHVLEGKEDSSSESLSIGKEGTRQKKEEMEEGVSIGPNQEEEKIIQQHDKGASEHEEVKEAAQVKEDDAAAAAAASMPLWRQKLQTTALLIISHDRAAYLNRCLEAVLTYHPGDSLVPVIVSEDGQHGPMASVVKKYQAAFKEKYPGVSFIHIHHQPTMTAENGYFKLADHYKWALSQVVSTSFLL